jgi:hypothetical protein
VEALVFIYAEVARKHSRSKLVSDVRECRDAVFLGLCLGDNGEYEKNELFLEHI